MGREASRLYIIRPLFWPRAFRKGFETSDMDGWRINKVLARRVDADGESSVAHSTLTPHPNDA